MRVCFAGRWLALTLLAGCGSVPDGDAVAACGSIFDAWVSAAERCSEEASMPSRETVCSRAYSYDDDELRGDCLPWIGQAPCDELNNERFQAHCGRALYFRTW